MSGEFGFELRRFFGDKTDVKILKDLGGEPAALVVD